MPRRLPVLCFFLSLATTAVHTQEVKKDASALYPAPVTERVRSNVANDPWAATVRDRIVEAAAFWRDMSDDDLWKLIFSPNLERSWMVWSNGYSPVTGKPVPMYNWVMDAQNHPWKTQDPTSGEWFPKNDFKAYYESGLDAQRIFDPNRADKSLLFNTEHPDPNDPLHQFGVDDGTGYVNEKGDRWRFIGAYLIYGQWKQLIVSGIRILSAAYMLTGDPVYAHKAGVLLDRVADLYPEYNFKTQGILYEGPAVAGYVSTWHDTCEETREMIMAYDMVFEGIRNDTGLVSFLSKKAAEAGLENPKATFADIQRNIEGRVLRDALAHPEKIHSNYPRAEICKAVTTAVLQEPADAFWAIVDPMIEKSTAVDGVTGEKGLAGYASFTISALGSFLSEFSKADPQFLSRTVERHPALRNTFRFFIDMLCLQRYHPLSGDTGHYASTAERYLGVDFIIPGENLTGWGNWTLLSPSNYRFMWQLYELTGDPAYVQVLYQGNGGKFDNLPYDIYGDNPRDFQNAVQRLIQTEGNLITPPSVNKQAWHIAILRSGNGRNERALWLDYDSGGGHGHQDGMNLGLFAHGLDFMPEMGYPPVQFGGWGSPRARWYTMTAAHNTVVVDGKDQRRGDGEATLWVDGATVRAIRANGPAMPQIDRYERTAVLIDIDESHFYVIDVFRVKGGTDHAKFQQSHFGPLTTAGLNLQPADDFGNDTQMRNFQIDPAATPGWQAEWTIEDRYKLLAQPAKLGMTYWDFTTDAAAGTAEGWIVAAMYEGHDEVWIPRLVVRRQSDSDSPLESTFVAVAEPWRDTRGIAQVRRLPVTFAGVEPSDTEVALEITLQDGRRDIAVVRDPSRISSRVTAIPGDAPIETDAELALVRMAPDNTVVFAAMAQGKRLTAGESAFELAEGQQYFEFIAE